MRAKRKAGTTTNPTPAKSASGRAMLSFSRANEYIDTRELQTMTGQPVERFPDVVLKELVDNGYDAAEAVRRAPNICVRLARRGRLIYLIVRDNGAGIAPETVTKVLDFNTRTSDKAAYRAPTRGAQGNALKTVLGIPVALGVRAPVYIEACGVRHRIEARIDPAGEVRVKHETKAVAERVGTVVAVPLPASRCEQTRFVHWGRSFSLFNPHGAVRILNPDAARKQAQSDGRQPRNSYRPTVAFPGDWRKFLPTDLTSPWWYDEPALAKLAFGQIAADEKCGSDRTLRDFVRQFRGLSGTAKAKVVCDRLPDVRRLADFVGRERDIPRLLAVMRENSQPPSAGILGQIGEESFRQRFDRWYGVERWWYRKAAGQADGVPFVVEVALAQTARPGRLFHGVNFSPTFDDPLAGTFLRGSEFAAYGVAGFLESGHASPRDRESSVRAAAAFHLICPGLETLDKGKTRLKVPDEIAEEVAKALWSAAKELYREEERRRKDAARQERADRARERAADTDWSLKQAVFEVMPRAVQKSAGELGRVSAHTLFYHVRPLIQAYTSRELTSDYFEQTLLPAYQREVRAIPEVYYEPRGTLYEPHTGKAIPLGTMEVESYVFPSWLYDKILFVEKKGLWPVFEAARLAERYDMAIVAGEGYATEACRVLFAHADRGKAYQLFVEHDADPHGYNIARTLREETARMPGHHIEVIDLGLRLEAALAMGLPAEQFTRKKKLPQGLRLNELEKEYFEGRRAGPKSWICRRVELNALSGPDLIAFTERELQKAGARGKVIPPDDVLSERFRSAIRDMATAAVAAEWQARLAVEVDQRIAAAEGMIRAKEEMLRSTVMAALADQASLSWRESVGQVAREIVPETPPEACSTNGG